MKNERMWKLPVILATLGLALALVLTGCPNGTNGVDESCRCGYAGCGVTNCDHTCGCGTVALPCDCGCDQADCDGTCEACYDGVPPCDCGCDQADCDGTCDECGNRVTPTELTLSGQVWIEDWIDWVLEITEFDGDLVVNSNFDVTGNVHNGRLNFTMGSPHAAYLDTIENVLPEILYGWGDGINTGAGANAAWLRLNTEPLGRLNRSHREGMVTESVSFIFVDRAVTITGESRTESGFFDNQEWEAFSLALESGWNAIHLSNVLGLFDITYTVTLGDPGHLRWMWVEGYYNGGDNGYDDAIVIVTPLTLSGDVYLGEQDWLTEMISITGRFNGDTDVTSWGVEGVGDISDGVLNFTLDGIRAWMFQDIGDTIINILSDWEHVEISNPQARVALFDSLHTDTPDGRVFRGYGSQNGTASIIETAMYIFVDQDVEITSAGGTTSITCENICWDVCFCEYGGGYCPCGPETITTADIAFSLQEGWNALHFKRVMDTVDGESYISVSVSIGHPDHLKWILEETPDFVFSLQTGTRSVRTRR